MDSWYYIPTKVSSPAAQFMKHPISKWWTRYQMGREWSYAQANEKCFDVCKRSNFWLRKLAQGAPMRFDRRELQRELRRRMQQHFAILIGKRDGLDRRELEKKRKKGARRSSILLRTNTEDFKKFPQPYVLSLFRSVTQYSQCAYKYFSKFMSGFVLRMDWLSILYLRAYVRKRKLLSIRIYEGKVF